MPLRSDFLAARFDGMLGSGRRLPMRRPWPHSSTRGEYPYRGGAVITEYKDVLPVPSVRVPRARAGETSGCSSCVHNAHALTPEEQTLVNVPLWIWAVTIGAMIAILALDLVIVDRPWSKTKGPSEFGLRQASWWAVFYIALAVVFGFGVMYFGGTTAGAEYFAGFVTEKSLSIDNLFVFYLLISAFVVPRRYQ